MKKPPEKRRSIASVELHCCLLHCAIYFRPKLEQPLDHSEFPRRNDFWSLKGKMFCCEHGTNESETNEQMVGPRTKLDESKRIFRLDIESKFELSWSMMAFSVKNYQSSEIVMNHKIFNEFDLSKSLCYAWQITFL